MTLRFILMCVGVWLYAADTLVTATIAPAIVLEIGGVEYINWTIALYEVGAIMAGALGAIICARIGVRKALIAAAILYSIGCVIAAAAATVAAVVAGRFIQGLGGGLLLSLCYLAIHQWFAKEQWNRLFGIIAIIWGAGSLLGPLIGALFSNQYSWRGAFWFFALQAGVLSLAAALWLPAETATAKIKQQWPLSTLVILAAATLVTSQAGVANGPAAATMGCLLGIILLYLAARLDRRSPSRLLPRELLDFRHPLGAGLLMIFAMCMATTGFWAYGPLLLKIVFGTNPLISGYILAAEALAWSVATVSVSRASPAAEVLLIRAGMCIVAVGAAGFAFAVPAGVLAGMVLCALLQGLGFGLCWPAIVHRIVALADLNDQSLAASAPSVIQRIGYAVGTAAAGVAANLSGLVDGISIPAAKTAAFWVFAGFFPILVVGLYGAWVFTGRIAEPQKNSDRP